MNLRIGAGDLSMMQSIGKIRQQMVVKKDKISCLIGEVVIFFLRCRELIAYMGLLGLRDCD